MHPSRLSNKGLNSLELRIGTDEVEKGGVPCYKVRRLYLLQGVLDGGLIRLEIVEWCLC